MSNCSWQEGHPPLETLFLHIEGELKNASESAVAAHVADCWECQRQCEEFRQGIFAFMQHRRNVLLPSVTIPRLERLPFLDDLRSSIVPDLWSALAASLRKLPRFRRNYSFALAAAGAVALIWILLVERVPSVTAAELLARGIVSEEQAAPPIGKYTVRRLEIRSGQRVSRWQVVVGSKNAPAPVPSLDADLAALLRSAPLDWKNPLTSTEFSAWHAAQSPVKDEVYEGGDRFTIATTLPGERPLRRALLVLRKSDWHAIRERLEFRNGVAVEVMELAYEVHSAPPQTSARLTPAAPVLAVAPATPPMLRARPNGELEMLEAEVRTTLHSLEVGVNGEEGEAAIRRTPAGLRVEIITATRGRRDILRQALGRIPGVESQIRAAEDSPPSAVPASARQPAALPQTKPLLQNALYECFGNAAVATNEAADLQADGERLAVLAGQLLILANRYPASELESLPQDARVMIDAIAADLLHQMASVLDKQRSRFEPVLQGAFPGLRLRGELSNTPEVASASWSESAQQVFDLSTAIAHDSNHLFASVGTEDVGDRLEPTLESFLNAQERLRSTLRRIEQILKRPCKQDFAILSLNSRAIFVSQ